MSAPRADYLNRLEAFRRRSALLQRKCAQWELAPGAATGCLFVLMILAAKGVVGGLWLLAPGVAALAAHFVKEDLRSKAECASRGVRYYERAVGRFDGKWVGLGPSGSKYGEESHPYAHDLDVVGVGSLFDFLCTARTAPGEETVAGWLLAPARTAEVIRARHEAVAELRGYAQLREDLAVLADGPCDGVEGVLQWSEGIGILPGKLLMLVAYLTQAAVLAAFLGGVAFGWGPWPIVATVGVAAGATFWLRSRVARVLAEVVWAHRQLVLVAEVAARLERECFSAPLLSDLHQSLCNPSAAHSIRRLGKLAGKSALLNSEFLAPVAYAFALPLQLAGAMELWRARFGQKVRTWLRAVGELEALLALAGHAFEFPDHVFPDVVDGAPIFHAEGLGHPFLHETACVRNDVLLSRAEPFVMLSGSNMSGKSTLLRSVGLAGVLAQAGAPVRARSMRLSLISIGASVRVGDSVLDGVSRFYAEVQKLRRIVELAEGGHPLLFLLDEILSGTNSNDRRHGAEGLLRGLLDRGALGMCTTHDLALTDLVGALDGRARNAHFCDSLRDGRLVFDYLLRPGVVEQSNALEIMRAVGLRV